MENEKRSWYIGIMSVKAAEKCFVCIRFRFYWFLYFHIRRAKMNALEVYSKKIEKHILPALSLIVCVPKKKNVRIN